MTTPGPTVLGVFAKWPEPGEVKTRLAAETSADWAAQVARAFLEDTLDRLHSLADRRIVVAAPDRAVAAFAELTRGQYDVLPQGTGHLGERLHRFVSARLREKAASVVVVGTDSPTLPADWIRQAFVSLQDSEVVLGPCTDGGYYLLGCRTEIPGLFEEIDWSSAHVLQQTVARLTTFPGRVALLPPWYDIDTLADWRMLTGHLLAMRRAEQDPGVPRTEHLVLGAGS